MSSYALPLPGMSDAGYASVHGSQEGFGEPGLKNCAPGADEGTNTFDALCGQTAGFNNSYGFSFADLAEQVKANAIANGQRPPDYVAYRFSIGFGSLFPAYKGCKSIFQEEANGWCGDHDWGATNSHMIVSGGTGEWIAPYNYDYGPVSTDVHGIGPPSLSEDAPAGTWQQGIWWAVNFAGLVVNPSPPSGIAIPSTNPFGPQSYGGSLLFSIDDPPPDDVHVEHSVSGNNFPNVGHTVEAFGYSQYPDVPPPPDNISDCRLKRIRRWLHIDSQRDNGMTSVGYGDKGGWNTSDGVVPDDIAVDDLLVVTTHIYSPDKDPQLFLGHFAGGNTDNAFTDDTANWIRFGPFRKGDIWSVVHWKIATANDAHLGSASGNGSLDFVLVNGNIYSPNDSTGGVSRLCVWGGAKAAYIEYYMRAGGTSHQPPPPNHAVEHTFFGREPDVGGGFVSLQEGNVVDNNWPPERHWQTVAVQDADSLYCDAIVALDGTEGDIPFYPPGNPYTNFHRFTTSHSEEGVMLAVRIVCDAGILVCFV